MTPPLARLDRKRASFAAFGLASLVMVVAGCASTGSTGTSSSESPPPTSTGATSLTVTVQASADAPADGWSLTCDPAGGTHPDSEAACAALAAASDPFAPVPPTVACTEIYGGPQIATLQGTYEGEPVNATFTRSNGCEIARWDVLAPVFVIPGGVL
jgi:hypothetical protein